MSGIHIPSDLASLNLTLPAVIEIIENRKALKRVENRLAALPAKAEALRKEIENLNRNEVTLLAQAGTLGRAVSETPTDATA